MPDDMARCIFLKILNHDLPAMRDSWRVVVQDGLEASVMTYCNESVTLNTATVFFHFFPESTICHTTCHFPQIFHAFDT